MKKIIFGALSVLFILTGCGDKTTESVLEIEGMAFVKGGSFEMGDHFNEGGDEELPVHEVTINSFYIGKYEVKQGEYESVMGSNPANNHGVGDNYPVYSVTWINAAEYCNTLSILYGLTPCYNQSDWSCDFSADGYRLPTEAEWEYAARGGINWTDDYKYSGTTIMLSNYAWFGGELNSPRHEVGTKFPNQLDIYDMSGNVWEWCYDLYSENYFQSSSVNNPIGHVIRANHVIRGGCSTNDAHSCRVARRGYECANSGRNCIGFRIVRRLL
ncbi:MAG: formylglycine-generating enzyme family protein [Candidatus Cloacimonetes bacterium]|nr:formylglycine-generating enzyme family protein [Candidatus Cloacimonadota bacterium]